MGIDTHKVCKCGSYASEYTMSTGIRTCRDCGSVLSINGVFQKSSPCFEMTDEEIDKYMGVKRKLYTLTDLQTAQRLALEKAARIVHNYSLPSIQSPSMWLIDKRAIEEEIRALYPLGPLETRAETEKAPHE